MFYYVYMLRSMGIKPITYVGYTKNLNKRIVLHNSGKGAKFTRGRKWKLIFREKLTTKNKAILMKRILDKICVFLVNSSKCPCQK